MKSYRVSMPIWGTSVVTVVADSEQEAADMGEVVFRTAFQQQTTFAQFLAGDEVVGDDVISNFEVEHTIDTEFDVEAGLLHDENDERVEAMALAYMQEVYGINSLSGDPILSGRARVIARKMLEAADA